MPERLEASIPMLRTPVLIACWLAAAAVFGPVALLEELLTARGLPAELGSDAAVNPAAR